MKRLVMLAALCTVLSSSASVTVSRNNEGNSGVFIKVSKENDNSSNITLNIQISGSNDRDIADLTDVLSTWLSSSSQGQSGYFSKQQLVAALLSGSICAATVVAAHLVFASK